jgi:hypothetical protein
MYDLFRCSVVFHSSYKLLGISSGLRINLTTKLVINSSEMSSQV